MTAALAAYRPTARFALLGTTRKRTRAAASHVACAMADRWRSIPGRELAGTLVWAAREPSVVGRVLEGDALRARA